MQDLSQRVRALKDVTLTIPVGMYGLLGPNGAGKSTLMRILATLQEPDGGSVRLGDTDVLHQKDEVRQTLGYLPQEFGVYPKVSAENLLDHFALLKGIAKRRARQDSIGKERIAFEAVVGTDADQVAVAPGALRGTWTEGGRCYFRYSTDVPIDIESGYAFFSADYAVREGRWNDVAIRIYHHPGHAANLDRMLRGVRASLDYYTEQFGPYPYRRISLVEYPGYGGMHAEASVITFQEGFSLFNLEGNSRGPDFPFSVVAHEVAHQWWGVQLAPASVEGAALLSESLAEYSAFQVVKKTYGQEHLRRLLSFMRTAYEIPRTRAGVPLLRATDSFLAYRKGPFAMYALSGYIGEERVNEALRRLLELHGSGAPPLPTSLDLYRELQAVTPDSLHYLLHDLFEANTFWELETERASAEQTEAGTWQVTLDVRARKVVVDTAGVETPVPMADWVEIGIIAPAEEGDGSGEPIYVQKHRIHAAEQTITVTACCSSRTTTTSTCSTATWAPSPPSIPRSRSWWSCSSASRKRCGWPCATGVGSRATRPAARPAVLGGQGFALPQDETAEC